MREKFVGYYRVSTKKQGESGLSLEGQRKEVREFASKHGELVDEFEDVVSGGNNNREGLNQAIKLAKRVKGKILIYRLDRFSRRVSFISSFLEQGIGLKIVDMPNTDTFQLHIHSAVSEEERRKCSLRTKEALKVARERGIELGKYGKILSKHNHDQAMKFACKTLSLIKSKYEMGVGYTRICNELNERGIKSWRGGKFYPSTVKNMISYVDSKRD